MMPSTSTCGWVLPSGASPSTDAGCTASPDPAHWPLLWARCWTRIRSWRVPPRWSPSDWWDEAGAEGALAAYEALRDFEPGRLVPLDAFLYRRVIESVWTRYRQEWSFGRRFRPDECLSDRAAEPGQTEPERLDHVAELLRSLEEGELRLIRQLYWDGRPEDQLAFDLGISRQAVNKRKRSLLRRLRSDLMSEGDP
jgi:DNA-directed RNA polymerase specialized sigma24 family protein